MCLGVNLVYLDQWVLIELSRDPTGKGHIVRTGLARKGMSLAIGFSHIFETAKAPGPNQDVLIKWIDGIPWVQIQALSNLIDMEMKNQLFRHLGFEKRLSIEPRGPIFDNKTEPTTFRELISHCSGPQLVEFMRKHAEGHDTAIGQLLTDTKSNFGKEHEGMVMGWAKHAITERTLQDCMPVKTPPNALKLGPFTMDFHWNESPYSNLYSAFQTQRYKNAGRKPLHDLADSEHAIVSALACDLILVDGNARDTLIQSARLSGITMRAKILESMDDLLSEMQS